MNPVLRQTQNYALFELHRFNRDIRGIQPLVNSMKKYGFLPHKSISCIKNGSGKLVVTDGHHRLAAAKELEIPVWYTLAENVGISIQEEQVSTRAWDLLDYLTSYVRNGAPAYIAVQQYVEETGIPLGLSISLLAGESAGSGNKAGVFKSGRYALGDQAHANIIKSIVLHMKAAGINYSSNSFFVQALSKALFVPDFSPVRFMEKVSSHAALFEKQPNVQSYLEMIETIYNRQSRNKVPVAFLAVEESKRRKDNFGRPY